MIINANSIVQHVTQSNNGVMINANVSVKIIIRKKDYSWNPSKCICENEKYLKSIVDNSKLKCGEIIYVVDIAPRNVTSTASLNSDDKKGRHVIFCTQFH